MANEIAWCREVLPPTSHEDDGSPTSDVPLARPQNRLALWKDWQWHGNGVRLRVAFIDKPTPPLNLQKHVVKHMNAWSEFCNVRFTRIDDPIAAEVRVSFSGKVLGEPKGGYWSYIGRYILEITDRRRPTMMLTGFTMEKTSEKTFIRKVRHETGHTLGFMHEHLRPEIVDRLDREKTIAAYAPGWNRTKTINNILTPLWEGDSSHYSVSDVADVHSIMCYPLDDSLLKKGSKGPSIVGGPNFSEYDKKHAALVYPIPKYEAWIVSEDKQTIGIAASGKALFLQLLSGEIRAIFEIDGDLVQHTIGEVDDPVTTKLVASGDQLYMIEDGYSVSVWDGSFASNTEEWTSVNGKEDNVQVDIREKSTYYRDESGMVVMYDDELEIWRVLYQKEDVNWVSSTKTHLYRQTNEGEIWQISVPHGDPKKDWKRIDKFTDTIQIVTNWRHVYQHRENGEIWVYSGIDRHWTKIFEQQSPVFLIEAFEDRLFRIEAHEDDDGSDVWYNDDNTEEGWKELDIEKNWAFFVYTGGYIYEFIQETGEVTRYTGLC
ncbi:hypothetical protein PQX77_008422 [Marasmius sp. AFHP31]|nr:hypothetical protein PQX77_013035 [Marasmius sp. AFHP31]KAK1228557.1 hypothetical protein PQX77_008422 [Marasmius sp. AFHP31]